MTVEIQIKRGDTSQVDVSIATQTFDTITGDWTTDQNFVQLPKDDNAVTMYIHSGQRLVVRELN